MILSCLPVTRVRDRSNYRSSVDSPTVFVKSAHKRFVKIALFANTVTPNYLLTLYFSFAVIISQLSVLKGDAGNFSLLKRLISVSSSAQP